MNRLVVESYGKEENAFGEISAFLHRRINEIPLGLCPVDYTLNVLNLAHAQSCEKCRFLDRTFIEQSINFL